MSAGVGAALVTAAVAEARRRGVAELGLRAELRRADGSYADDVWMALWLHSLT